MYQYCINGTCYPSTVVEVVPDFNEGIVLGFLAGMLVLLAVALLLKYQRNQVYRQAVDHPEDFEKEKNRYKNKRHWED